MTNGQQMHYQLVIEQFGPIKYIPKILDPTICTKKMKPYDCQFV